jgi:7,8-dihydropterin-6-yl-methyl-4-(beta-D-ribofuranosyl)aminobenzene 5'-phosphate synthase
LKISIVYDNTTTRHDLKADWGFSCLIEKHGRKILFDTGSDGKILLDNMKKLGTDPCSINEVFISHEHWDHTGGLSSFLKLNKVRVYIPVSCHDFPAADDIVRIKDAREIHDDIFSTGELQKIEQSLIINTASGLVIVAGCSHPGVKNILEASSPFGKPIAIIGGLHDFNEFELIGELHWICPTHCTQYIPDIKSLYPDKFIPGGAGKVIEI